MDKIAKSVKDSKTEQVHIVMPGDTNGAERLFGGALMQWIDVVAAVVARRHSNYDVTTAEVDRLSFCAPARINDTVTLIGNITYVGNTSMEVRVETFVEALDGSREMVNTAYMVMVAVNENSQPCQVPTLKLETVEERAEWERAKKRHEARKLRRKC